MIIKSLICVQFTLNSTDWQHLCWLISNLKIQILWSNFGITSTYLMKIQTLYYWFLFPKSMKNVFSNTDPVCYIFIYNLTFISDIHIFQSILFWWWWSLRTPSFSWDQFIIFPSLGWIKQHKECFIDIKVSLFACSQVLMLESSLFSPFSILVIYLDL